MNENDSIKLLQECDAGAKMAVSSIDEVLDQVPDANLKQLLLKSKEQHTELGNKIHRILSAAHFEDKEPALMAKSMSYMKTNVKLAMEPTDATIADLMTDGCDMGTKSLYRYRNQYKAANKESQDICLELADIEEKLRLQLRDYL